VSARESEIDMKKSPGTETAAGTESMNPLISVNKKKPVVGYVSYLFKAVHSITK